MISRTERSPLTDWWWSIDRLMLAALGTLMLAGIVLSLAASPPVAARIGLDAFHFVNRHVMYLAPAFIVLITTSLLEPRQIRRLALMVFALSLVLMYFLYSVQRAEEMLVIDCQDYCQEHLLLRLYDPKPSNEFAIEESM